jgi:hypothetical protein
MGLAHPLSWHFSNKYIHLIKVGTIGTSLAIPLCIAQHSAQQTKGAKTMISNYIQLDAVASTLTEQTAATTMMDTPTLDLKAQGTDEIIHSTFVPYDLYSDLDSVFASLPSTQANQKAYGTAHTSPTGEHTLVEILDAVLSSAALDADWTLIRAQIDRHDDITADCNDLTQDRAIPLTWFDAPKPLSTEDTTVEMSLSTVVDGILDAWVDGTTGNFCPFTNLPAYNRFNHANLVRGMVRVG